MNNKEYLIDIIEGATKDEFMRFAVWWLAEDILADMIREQIEEMTEVGLRIEVDKWKKTQLTDTIDSDSM